MVFKKSLKGIEIHLKIPADALIMKTLVCSASSYPLGTDLSFSQSVISSLISSLLSVD